MAIQAANIADLVSVTLENVERLRFTDISAQLQRYDVAKMLKKGKVQFDAGTDFEWELMTGDNDSAVFDGLFSQDIVNPTDVMTRAKVPWRHVKWNWAFDMREAAMNASPLKIVDIVSTRRWAAFVASVKLYEKRYWRVPASTDSVNPYGVPYWIVKNATEGFYGTTPSGYTVVANINPSSFLNEDGTYKWANWTFQYAAVTRDDLIRKLRKAFEFTMFEPALPDMPTTGTGDDCEMHTTWALLQTLVEILQSNNDDLGPDIAEYENEVMLRGCPIKHSFQLDEDTTNPIYGINSGVFKTAGLRGWWNKETVIPHVAGQHTVAASFVDTSLNWFCYNRRRNFVGATGTTLPA